MNCLPKLGSPVFIVHTAVPLYESSLTCDFGTEQKRSAVSDWPAPMLVPSPRSTPFWAPMIPDTPKGGLETVIDKDEAELDPLFVTLNLRIFVCCSKTSPKVNGGLLLAYCTHFPDPSADWNSSNATAKVPAVPTTSNILVPPSVRTWT